MPTRETDSTALERLGEASRRSAEVRTRAESPVMTDATKRFKPSPENVGGTTRATLPPHLLPSSHVGEAIASPNVSRGRPGGGGPNANRHRPSGPVAKGKTERQAPQSVGRDGIDDSRQKLATKLRHDVAVAKLRLYLASRMLQAVRCSPNGGFGIPVDFILKEMDAEYGTGCVNTLFEKTSPNALILKECGDIVDLMPLRVRHLTKNGCVPSTQFRRDSTNVEARIRQEASELIAEAEAQAEGQLREEFEDRVDFYQAAAMETPNAPLQEPEKPNYPQTDLLTEKMQNEMVKKVLEDMMAEALTVAQTFPTVDHFVQQYEKEYEIDLNPGLAGCATALEMLQKMKLTNLIHLTEVGGAVYIVPATQAFQQHRREQLPVAVEEKCQTEGSIPMGHSENAISNANDIPPPPPPLPVEDVRPVVAQYGPGERVESGSVRRSLPEVQEGVSMAMETASAGTEPLTRFAECMSVNDDGFDEFDTEILDKLRGLFEATICRDLKRMCLNRLPLYFMRKWGSVLDYQRYGYINLADVVALLSDQVKVVETVDGKYIYAVERPLRRAGKEEEKAFAASQPVVISETPVWMNQVAGSDLVVWPPLGQIPVHRSRVGCINPGVQMTHPIAAPYTVPPNVTSGAHPQHDPTFYDPRYTA